MFPWNVTLRWCRCHYGFATKYDQMDEDELEELGLDEDEIAEAIVDEFDEWFRPFLENLNHEERRKLFDGPLYFELEEYDMDLGEYEIKIPAEIVELAKEGWWNLSII